MRSGGDQGEIEEYGAEPSAMMKNDMVRIRVEELQDRVGKCPTVHPPGKEHLFYDGRLWSCSHIGIS